MTNRLEKRKMHSIISIPFGAIGFVLMIGKIYADSEPGAIPLALVLIGVGWYFIARLRYGKKTDE